MIGRRWRVKGIGARLSAHGSRERIGARFSVHGSRQKQLAQGKIILLTKGGEFIWENFRI